MMEPSILMKNLLVDVSIKVLFTQLHLLF